LENSFPRNPTKPKSREDARRTTFSEPDAPISGHRRSEIFGLRRSDFNWLLREVFIQRSHVEGYEDETKTESLNAKLPLHPAIIDVLPLEWRRQSPFHADCDYVFASPILDRKQPLNSNSVQRGLSPTRVDQGGIKAAGLARAAPLVSHVAGREGNWSRSSQRTDAALDCLRCRWTAMVVEFRKRTGRRMRRS
jgi:hypothetical protein